MTEKTGALTLPFQMIDYLLLYYSLDGSWKQRERLATT